VRKKRRKQGLEPDACGLQLLDHKGEPWHTTPAVVADALRQPVSRWQVQDKGGVTGKLVITSTLRGEGTTFISRSLGDVIANDLQRTVCLVDLNWWNPSPPPGPDAKPGLSDIMRGETSIDETLVPTSNPTLWFLPAGLTDAAERPVLAQSEVLKDCVQQLEARFDHLILDVPALKGCGEALALTALGSGCVLVIRHGITTVDQAAASVSELSYVPLLGVILNQAQTQIPGSLLKRIGEA
jgi:Mrp family chromosome partitioning ATPase